MEAWSIWYNSVLYNVHSTDVFCTVEYIVYKQVGWGGGACVHCTIGWAILGDSCFSLGKFQKILFVHDIIYPLLAEISLRQLCTLKFEQNMSFPSGPWHSLAQCTLYSLFTGVLFQGSGTVGAI